MGIYEIINNIEITYNHICAKELQQQLISETQGLYQKRIHFEDIDLDAELAPMLIPLLPELLERFYMPSAPYRKMVYKIYVATLCEISKSGFPQGGILKAIQTRIGHFSNDHHYKLLKAALRYEGIDVLDNRGYRKWEETIINEAGIPRKYYRTVQEFFKIYWKWLKQYPESERLAFLRNFVDEIPQDKVFIADSREVQKIVSLREQMTGFREKVIKTCEKIDKVFTAIDIYDQNITEDNLDSICKNISQTLGFNVLSIIGSDELKNLILDYSTIVSFKKFQRILDNLPISEPLRLPHGVIKHCSSYKYPNFIGGEHIVRNHSYHVSYPIPLTVEDIFELPRNKIIYQADIVIYTSEDNFDVDVDEHRKPIRTFYHKVFNTLYVFVSKIPTAAFMYIDGQSVLNPKTYISVPYIGKCWDYESREYRLCLYIRELRYSDPMHAMLPIVYIINGQKVLNAQTNSHGYYAWRDKVIPLEHLNGIDELVCSFYVGNRDFENVHVIHMESFYIWDKQSGLRIHECWDLENWNRSNTVIVFSRDPIPQASFPLKCLYQTQGYHVFEGQVDLTKNMFVFDGLFIEVKKSNRPYVKLLNDFNLRGEHFCIHSGESIAISIENQETTSGEIILGIEHEYRVYSRNLSHILDEELRDIRKLDQGAIDDVGVWAVTIYVDSKKTNDIHFVVLPDFEVVSKKMIQAERESVNVIIKSHCPCFEEGNDLVFEKEQEIGTANLWMNGNLVLSGLIEFSCWIDRCNVSIPMSIRPNVWGLRMLDKTNNSWTDVYRQVIEYDNLLENELFLCTTAEIALEVKIGERKQVRSFHTGYNNLHIIRMFSSWSARNTVVILDPKGEEQQFVVHYPTIIKVGSVFYEKDTALIEIIYKGPAKTILSIRSFTKGNLIDTINRPIKANQQTTHIKVYQHSIKPEDEVVLEGRIESQDFLKIGSLRLFQRSAPTKQREADSNQQNIDKTYPIETKCKSSILMLWDERISVLQLMQWAIQTSVKSDIMVKSDLSLLKILDRGIKNVDI